MIRPLNHPKGMSRTKPVTLLMAALLLAGPLEAQMFRGVVVDDATKAPLTGAIVLLLDRNSGETGRSARTDSIGRYVLHASAAGVYRIRANRIGYAPLTSSPVSLLGGGVVTLDLAMSTVAARLGTVVVAGQRRLNRDDLMSTVGFDVRRSRGIGLFLDSTDLKQFREHPTTTFLPDLGMIPQILPGLRMIRGLTSGGRIGTCNPQLFVDGWEVKTWRLSSIVASEIHGLEIYSRVTLPPPSLGAEIGDYGGASFSAKCGAIVVWTKAYHASLQAKRKNY